MATVIWKGGAPAVAQVTAWVFGGTWEATDVIKVTIGTKTVSVVAGSTTIITIVDTVFAALNASTIPEFAEITWSRSSNSLVGTADTAGLPFAATVSTTETGGGAADSQTIDDTTSSAGTDSTTSAGPYDWSTAANWSGAAVPVNSDDVVFTNSSVDCLYGLAQSGVTLTSLTIDQNYTGAIGLPRTHGSGSSAYPEYRTTELTIGATTQTIGAGHGTGSGRIKINNGSAQTTLNLLNSGQPTESGTKAVQWRGTHTSNVVNAVKGSLSVAAIAGQTAAIATLRQGFLSNQAGDTDIYLGSGVSTLNTINKTGGSLVINSSVTTLNQGPGQAGTTTIISGTPTTVKCEGGTVDLRTTGTLGTLTVTGPGVADFSHDNRTKTVTNCTLNPGATLREPTESVTFTNPIAIVGPLSGVTLDLGSSFSLQRS